MKCEMGTETEWRVKSQGRSNHSSTTRPTYSTIVVEDAIHVNSKKTQKLLSNFSQVTIKVWFRDFETRMRKKKAVELID